MTPMRELRFFFFFQAEDGIRDLTVTGVQTCALPISVLVGGGTMPSSGDLPESMAALSRRQALEIRDTSFEDDAKLLAAALQKVPGLSPARARGKRWAWMLIAAAILLAAGGVGLLHAR